MIQTSEYLIVGSSLNLDMNEMGLSTGRYAEEPSLLPLNDDDVVVEEFIE